MSSFIEGRRDDARGANRIEPERAGAVEGIARSEARAFAAAGSGRAVAAEPAPGAASAAEGETGRGWRADASAAGEAVEPEDSRLPAAPNSGRGAAAVRRLRPHSGRRATGAARVAGQPGDVAAVDDGGRVVESTSAAAAAGACLARATGRLWGIGDDGQFAVSLAGGTRAATATDRDDRRCQQPFLGTVCRTRFDRRELPNTARLVAALRT